MKILTYSPKVEVYVATTEKDGSAKYYDLTRDVTSVTVVRTVDEASRFTVHLQNKNSKYNNIFTPMDRVVIYAVGAPQNGENRRYVLLAGYIKKADRHKLYNDDFIIEGRDTIYRLQELFWDPQLVESQSLLRDTEFINKQDTGAASVLTKLLVKVGGMNAEDVLVGKIPSDIIDFAFELYQAKREANELAASMIEDFHTILKEKGKQINVASAGAADFSGSDAVEQVWNFCISQGFSKEAAAATIGNVMQECGGNPGLCQGGGGPGRGLFQWEIGSDRFARLEQIASSMGTTWEDVKAQLTLFQEELPGEFQKYTGHGEYWKPPYTKYGTWWKDKVTFDEWKRWTDIPKATECLERVYMRPSMPMREKRIQYAQAAYAKYA